MSWHCCPKHLFTTWAEPVADLPSSIPRWTPRPTAGKAQVNVLFPLVSCCQGPTGKGGIKSGHPAATSLEKKLLKIWVETLSEYFWPRTKVLFNGEHQQLLICLLAHLSVGKEKDHQSFHRIRPGLLKSSTALGVHRVAQYALHHQAPPEVQTPPETNSQQSSVVSLVRKATTQKFITQNNNYYLKSTTP